MILNPSILAWFPRAIGIVIPYTTPKVIATIILVIISNRDRWYIVGRHKYKRITFNTPIIVQKKECEVDIEDITKEKLVKSSNNERSPLQV